MSPGATFERVYHELKRMLAEGELPPGTPIEPALIGKQIASSITPIRDALHRLTGELLVEAPNHNGFRVPQMSEAALRDLYHWNEQLLALAVRRSLRDSSTSAETDVATDQDLPGATARLFAEIARSTGSGEHLRAVERVNDRLAHIRGAERRVLPALAEELNALWQSHRDGDRKQLERQLRAYHRRRTRFIAAVLAS